MNKHQLKVAKKPNKKPEDHGDFLARKKELEGVFERGKAAARDDKLAIWSETVDWWQPGSSQPCGVFTGDERATRRSRGTSTQLLTNNNPVPQHYMNTGTGGMEFGYDGGGTVNANAASAGGRSSQSRRPESSGKAMGNLSLSLSCVATPCGPSPGDRLANSWPPRQP
jgi:ketosteroid isomerase-like protein